MSAVESNVLHYHNWLWCASFNYTNKAFAWKFKYGKILVCYGNFYASAWLHPKMQLTLLRSGRTFEIETYCAFCIPWCMVENSASINHQSRNGFHFKKLQCSYILAHGHWSYKDDCDSALASCSSKFICGFQSLCVCYFNLAYRSATAMQ